MRKKHSTETVKIDLESEQILEGRAVSRGVGVGKSFCLYGERKQFARVSIKGQEIESEINRFRTSVNNSKKQLKEISLSKNNLLPTQIEIFKVHKLFLEDVSFLTEIESKIAEQKVNCEWAIKVVTDKFIAIYKALPDKHLREKYIDLEDVSERLINALNDGITNTFEFDENTIIIAKELNPSTLIEISKHNPKAIVTENGGWTSHTFILARELQIPAVTGVKKILNNVETGDEILVDGFQGKVIINPSANTTKKYKISKSSKIENIIFSISDSLVKLKTLDGFEVIIRANLDSSINYKLAKDSGAKGIGLYRSESLFKQNGDFPSESEQLETYNKLANLAGENGVRIRTFDLSLSQISKSRRDKEKNPALGLRGIRIAKKIESEFRKQIRAILKASYEKNVDLILPMVSDVSEIIWAKSIISDEKKNLELRNIDVGNPKLGTMIEVPSAILTIDNIFEESDFVSIGTNDLVQYLLAVDRDNENVADWFITLHPAVLNSIKIVLNASKRFAKPAMICGEMAGSPLYVPILIAFGANELSMNPNSINRVRNIITNIAQEEAKEIVAKIEVCKTVDDVEVLLNNSYKEKWKHLYESENF